MTEHMPIGRRPGPKPDPARKAIRHLFSEWSDRTFARYWRAHKRLTALQAVGAIDASGYRDAMAKATRPNGSLNVIKLDQMTEAMAAAWVVEQYGDDE